MDSLTVPGSAKRTRSRTKAAWIAVFLGTFGFHRLYLGQTLQACLYVLFCWTLVPTVLGVIEGIRFFQMTDERFAALYARPIASVAGGAQGVGGSPSTTNPAAAGSRIRASHMPDSGESPILEAEGNGGHIWVFADKVRIKHFGVRGLVSKGFFKGDKEIWVDQIAGIQWRNPGAMWLGHLQFEVIGGSSSTKRASEDENAVMFDASRRVAFEEVKRTVEQLMREARAQARGPQTASSPVPEIPDQLRKLAELRDAGILTADEFDAKKTELLGRM